MYKENLKKLPIGISTLAKIIEGNFAYIDKTHHIANLINHGGQYYFLSRPRRFGKSLLVDTLKQAFLGNKNLFKGLYLEHNWDWDKSYPVIHFDFGAGTVHEIKFLYEKINSWLESYFREYEIENPKYADIGNQFSYLLTKLAKKVGKIVLLIDEYDKPILDNIDDNETALIMREELKNLYSVIKAHDADIEFVLLTGVSKFSKVSLFSGLNNLQDISLTAQYADICGYTQSELENVFAGYLKTGNVDLELLRKWYNGYNFAGREEQKVYNPFDILLFCSNGYQYRNYWFETATPTFLVKLIEKNSYFTPRFEKLVISDKELASFDVDNIPFVTLLFQTGYLTIKKITTIGTQYAYELTYPNLEVKASLNDSLTVIGTSSEAKNTNIYNLSQAVLNNDFSLLENVINSHFASIPHDWYRNNHIANYEGFYASIVYSYLCALGYDLIAEDVSNQGKIDLTLKMPDKVFIFEFKLSKYGSATEAIEQIKTKNYPQKYLAQNKPIHLIGISFDIETKNIIDFKHDKIVDSGMNLNIHQK